MDLTQLANVGEFIGGVAVLVTLAYLAAQVRQSNAVQRQTARLAAGDAVQNSVGRFTEFRRMVAEETTGTVWAKARRDETLTHTEELRVRAILQELAFAAVANIELYRSTGAESFLDGIPSAVAVELEGSAVLARAWDGLVAELRVFGFGEFADAVRAQLGRGNANAPVA